MADRFPLIIDSVDQQIQELSSGDNLDLASSGVVNANLVHSSGVNVGVVTATKFKGDGSELDNLPASGGTLEATASGTLADGSKVIVNVDGTVSVVAQDETTGAGAGTPEVFASTSTNAARSATYDSTNNRVVVAYQDGWDSDHGKAAVGEISGTDITFGTPVKFASNGKTDKIAATFDSVNSRVVIAYEDAGNSSYGTAVVGEVDPSNNSIDFGTPEVYEFATTTGGDVDTAITFDSTNGKVVIAYRDAGNSNYGTAIVGEVDPNDNSIDFGTPEVFYQGNAQYISATFDSSNGRVVIAYSNRQSGQAYQGEAIVGTVSGNSISFPNSAFEFNSARSDYITATFDASKSRVVIAYISMASSPSGYGTAIVGEVNPSNNSITFGSQVNFNTTGSTPFSSAVYDASNNNVVISYMDNGNSAHGTVIVGTVDPNDNSIEFGSSVVFESAGSYWTSSTYTTDGKVVISYLDNGNSNYGTAVVFGQSGFSPVPEVGSEKVFSSATTYYTSASYDSTNNKVVIAYMDMGDNGYGKAVVGTVSGTSISFGTPVTFNSGQSSFISVVYDSTNQRVVIAYRDSTAPSYTNYGTAIVGEVDPNDNSIDFGTPVTFNTTNTEYISATYDSTNSKVVIAYLNTVLNHGQGIVGTVDPTDNSIEFGPAQSFETAPSNYISAVFDSTNGKVVIAYSDQYDNNYGKVAVGTFNGSTITFGVPVTAFNSSNTDALSAVYDPSSQKVVVIYRDAGNSYVSSAIVGEVSGTGNSISFPSSAVTFDSFSGTQLTPVYDPDNQNIVLIYRDGSNSSYGTALLMTVSGTSISFGSSTVFNAANTYYISATYDSSNKKVVISYADYGNSQYATAITFSSRTISNNLTSENFIGISNGAYSDGQTATIQIAGAVDDAQSGLTPGQQYYVQNDGTLSETADSPSVLAGTAVAATKLIIG